VLRRNLTLSAALSSLETLEKSEVMRLRAIIQGAKVYKVLFADYVDYRGLEAELMELKAKWISSQKRLS
jgi:hypothetical protein